MDTHGEMPEKLSPKQVAELLGKAVTTLQDWRNKRRGPPFVREEGLIFYYRDDLERWRKASRVDTLKPRAAPPSPCRPAIPGVAE